jgi:carbamoyl-phosphate synthase large subunit
MTDPDFADKTYIEPLTVPILEEIIAKERPQALLPTMGGQTALNLALGLSEAGVLKKYNVELIGAKEKAIHLAENRNEFKKVLDRTKVEYPKSGYAYSLEEGLKIAREVKYPCIIRASFTLGGTGASIAYSEEQFKVDCQKGLDLSPVHEVLVEESVLGWKEYELEVVRDLKDNVIIICSIENFDPMGVHTGDSITVAPQQTLTDREYQKMRDSAIRIIREVGVETGGSNIQFAVDPITGRQVAIEMNPRVSRSSALASKATGFPIAKIAAKLSVGYTLDEIINDITKKTLSCFEPSIDYVVTKIPRFAFEKFPREKTVLGPQMRSVGEVMAMGRTFKESLQKALRSLEMNLSGLDPITDRRKLTTPELWKKGISNHLANPRPDRILWIAQALREGFSVEQIYGITKVDPYFLRNMAEIVNTEAEIKKHSLSAVEAKNLRQWKRLGFSDKRLSQLLKVEELDVRNKRKSLNILPVYKQVDTCAGEFPSETPYLYSTYENQNESVVTSNKKVLILGSGPNRIGQGVEFDYCCVQASFALREENVDSLLVNCNPETVSTDYDVSDKLYFEPLTLEDILNIIDLEKPDGIIVHFGGQTPLNLSKKLVEHDVKILGTSAEAIEISEDREKFKEFCEKLNLKIPKNAIATSREQAEKLVQEVGYPLILRPSFVLGGRGMQILYSHTDFKGWFNRGIEISKENPLLIDKFLKKAIELDVDAICDGEDVLICGILEQIQEAGVHSGDSASILPPITISKNLLQQIEEQTKKIALSLKVKGLMNIQFAIENNEIFILEVNPRASRTVPFVSKARGVSFAKVATKVMLGKKLKELDLPLKPLEKYFVKESVFPFKKFSNSDIILGPEMRSTGEVMGVGKTFGEAFYKACAGSGYSLPEKGVAFLSVRDEDKDGLPSIATELIENGFKLVGTKGTAKFLREKGIEIEPINKVNEGKPHIVESIYQDKIQMVINTSALGIHEIGAAYELRRSTLMKNISYFTTIAAAKAAAQAISTMRKTKVETYSLQESL